MLKFLTLKAESKNTSSDEPIAVETSWRQMLDRKWSDLHEKPKSISSQQDVINNKAKQEKLENYYNDRTDTTWRERLAFMWELDDLGMMGPELMFVKQATEITFLGGLSYGAYHESAKVYRIFLDQNKYTMFQHPREAQRALQERIVLAILQGGWRVGWRMAVLSFTFTSVVQSMTVIRNYINPLDYALGGGVMGAVYKFHMGPRGMMGAGVGGALFGLQAGIITWCVQKLSGETVAERWAREYGLVKEKKEIEIAKAENKDPRREIVIEESKKEIAPRSDFETKEEEDWVRNITVKITEWLEKIGFIRSHSGESFRIVNDVKDTSEVKPMIDTQEVESVDDYKTDIKTASDIQRTQPDHTR